MDQRCGFSRCPDKPKFSCRQHLNKVFCEIHIFSHISEAGQHRKISLKELEKSSITSAAIKRISDNSVLASKVLLTGKDMFQQICDKLCQITDDLIGRQNALSEIATNITGFDNPLERIQKLGDISLNLRSKKEFAKLINQHFSKQDSTFDFTLFKADIDGIVNSIKLSNECMEKIREEAAKDKNERNRILNELSKMEESNVRIEKTLEDKINEVSMQMRVREKNLASAGLVEAINDKVQVIEYQAMTSNRLINQINARCDLLERENKSVNIINKESQDNNLKFITEVNDIIEVKLTNLELDYEGKIVDLRRNWAEREENFRIEEERIKLNIEEKFKKEIKVFSDKNDKISKEVNETIVSIRNQIESNEKSCNMKVDKEIIQVRETISIEISDFKNNFYLELQKSQRERDEVLECMRRQLEKQNKIIVGFEKFKELEEKRKQHEETKHPVEVPRASPLLSRINIDEVEKSLKLLLSNHTIEELNREKKFVFSVGTKSALSLLNTMEDEKFYVGLHPVKEFIWTFRIFLQLTGKTLNENDISAWEEIS